MNPLTLKNLLSNKHTTGAGIAYIAASAMQVLGPVWFPGHANQFKVTAEWIHGAAAAYGFAMAGDASKSAKEIAAVDVKVDQTAKAVLQDDTTILPKPTPPPEIPKTP